MGTEDIDFFSSKGHYHEGSYCGQWETEDMNDAFSYCYGEWVSGEDVIHVSMCYMAIKTIVVVSVW